MLRRKSLIASSLAFVLLTPFAFTAPTAAQEVTIDPGDSPAKVDATPEVIPSETGSYIVVMLEAPLVASIEADALNTPAAEAEAVELVEDHVDVLEETGIDTAEKVQDYTNALNGFSATISHAEALKLAANPKVALVLPDEWREATTDSSAEFLGLTAAGGAYASGFDGEGVVVGVIDTGIWPEHPSFADDGTYAAPPAPIDGSTRPNCEFGNTAHNPDDAPFTCNNKLIGARQMLDTYRALIGAEAGEFDSARDDGGHGTHTASTAAGNADVPASIFGKDYGDISGIAPRAHVVAYKGLGKLGGFTSDLTAAIDQAVADGVDVINYSIGGGNNLISADAIAFLFAADAGVWVATSAGNSGPGSETIGGPADVPWITTVGANTQRRFLRGTVNLTSNPSPFSTRPRKWQGASVTPELDIKTPIVDAEFAGGDLCLAGTLDPAVVAGNVVLCRRGAVARMEKSREVFDTGGVGMILYNNEDADNLFTDNHWVPSVHVNNTDGVAIKSYLARNNEPMATIDNTGKKTIGKAPVVAFFSSRGANVSDEDIIKPDITAPGVQILAGNTPVPDPGTTPAGEYFQAISGTSMSSPHVAGFYALLRQAHPDWSAASAKSAIMTTANRFVLDSDLKRADPFDMGSGHLRPGRVNRKGTTWNPGIVYDAGFVDYLGFLCDADPSIFIDAAATCGGLAGAGVPTDASDLNYPSIAIAELAGSQTVIRTVTSVADSTVNWRATMNRPSGYDVTVTPSSITLAPGESATFEVTIANTGKGKIGEWAFGAVTWRGNGYMARSPIAVKGAALNTPASVSAEGADGAVSIPVEFGYTGDYSASPHGLVPATIHSDEISQDPDQTYPSADDGAGVDRIPVSLSGATFVRWELVIPGDDDIDLFLEDSAGNIIAASTAGGTDELIELHNPADGDYTMVVHGWSIPSDPLAYDLSEWILSATPGGSLVVDSAPASAVTGAAGSVEASWSGLDPATHYLGAVSHNDAAGQLGLTLVEVNT